MNNSPRARSVLVEAEARLIAVKQALEGLERRLAAVSVAAEAVQLSNERAHLIRELEWLDVRIKKRLRPLERLEERDALVRARDSARDESAQMLVEDVTWAKNRVNDLAKEYFQTERDYQLAVAKCNEASHRSTDFARQLIAFEERHAGDLAAAAAILGEGNVSPNEVMQK